MFSFGRNRVFYRKKRCFVREKGYMDMESRIYMKWLILLVGVLCSVGVKAVDVNSVSSLISALGGSNKAQDIGNNTVKLTDNVELKETITITDGDIILDLGGKSIYNGSYKEGLFQITKYYKIDIFVIKKGTLTIQGDGSVYNQEDENHSTIKVEKGTLNINGGYIYHNNSSKDNYNNYTAITIADGTVIMNSGKVEAVKAAMAGIGIDISGGKFYFNGGEIIGKGTDGRFGLNEQRCYGIKISGDARVHLKKGTITGQNESKNSLGFAISSNQSLNQIIVPGYGIYKAGTLQEMSATSVGNGTVSIDPLTYTISYEGIENASVSGDRPATYNVESEPITISATATKDYYDFQGWRLDNIVSKTITIPTGSIGNKTLVAVWKGKDYTIDYHLDEGATNSPNNQSTYTYSTENVTPIYDPSRSYYSFVNWYKDQSLTQLFGKEIPKGQSGNLDLYPKWKADTYPVKFYDGETELADLAMSRTVEKGIQENEMPKPSKDGYVFLHWTMDGSQTIAKVEAGHEPLSLKAVWKEVSYVVKYVSDGDTPFEDESYTKATVQEHIWKTEEHIKRDGYVFKGWFLDANFSEGSLLTAFPLDATKGSVSSDKSVVTYTIYAKWELKDYTIVFENCEGVNNKEYNITDGVSKENMPTPNPRNGYEFAGWYKNGGKIESIPQGTTEDMRLTAQWNLIEYAITYHTNGGTLSGETTRYTIEMNVELPTPNKNNYEFAGWYVDEQLTERFEEGRLVQAFGNKAFYAKWSPKEYTLSFVENGGIEIPNQDYTYGQEVGFARKTYRTAYTFVGWYKDEALTQPFGDKISAVESGDQTLYAKWTPIEYTISYDTYHGEILSGKVGHYTIEEEVVLPTDMWRDGFSFAGWYADDLLKEKVEKIGKGNYGDKTVYATWKPGSRILFSQPEYGKIEVKQRGKTVASGDWIGGGTQLAVTATPTDANHVLQALVIGGKTFSTSPQTVAMPAEGGLTISAVFADSRTTAPFP